MADPSFGTGWPQGNPNIVTLVRNDGLRIPIHRELVDLTRMLMDLTEAMGYDILPGQTWGYANRNISGTGTPSNHSWGTADDINAPSNPYASRDWHSRNARGTFPFGLRLVTDIPQKVVELWEKYGYRWGGKYETKPDPMHFEFMGTVADARRLTALLKANYDNEAGGDDMDDADHRRIKDNVREIVQNNEQKVADAIDRLSQEIDNDRKAQTNAIKRAIWLSQGKTVEEVRELLAKDAELDDDET